MIKKLALRSGLGALVVTGLVCVWASVGHGQGHGTVTGSAATDLKKVRADLTAMDKGMQRVEQMHSKARRKKDIVKASCVQEKHVRIKNIIAMAREQFSRYLMDRMSGTPSATIPLKQQIGLFKERVDDLVGEAERCAGETVQVKRKTEVTEYVDPSVPRDDPTESTEEIWTVDRSESNSPFQ